MQHLYPRKLENFFMRQDLFKSFDRWSGISYRCLVQLIARYYGTSPFRKAGISRSTHEMELARNWLRQLNLNQIPRDKFDIQYSRSSGPGGQNVNKLNTKAMIRIALPELAEWMPQIVLEQIKDRVIISCCSLVDFNLLTRTISIFGI